MSPQTLSAEEKARRNFETLSRAGAMVLSLAQLASSYGRPEFPWVGAILFGTFFLHFWVERWLIPRVGGTVGERVRSGMNALTMLPLGHLQGWALVNWMWLPFNAMASDDKRGQGASFNLAFVVVSVSIAGLVDGAPVMLPVGFSALSAILYLLAQARRQFIEGILEDRERQNAELERAHRALEAMHQRVVMQEKLSSLGMLAAGIAHEINNPMSYVTSNVQALAAELPRFRTSPELIEEYRTDVLPATLDGLRRVNAIVADLRRFARGDPESLVEYDLNEEIRAAARIVQSRFAQEHALRLELAELPNLLGRPRQMTQVLVNLLVNAAQAMPERGTVTVSTALEGERIRVSVRDTGVGMDEATRKNLFQPFFTTKAVGEGTGLGLAVVHGIVRSHGGEILVESEVGKGSCFTLVLPQFPPPNLSLGLEPRAENPAQPPVAA